MRAHLLLAALSVGGLAACSAEAADPTAPSTTRVAATGSDAEGVRDALDRIALTFEGSAGDRVRAALQQVLAATRSGDAAAHGVAIRSALDALAELELAAGPEVGAEADAIRLALEAR